MKKYYKKEIVYYCYNEKDARELKDYLYQEYDDVSIYPNGTEEYRVVVVI